jgi:uncharacterized protein DUF1592/uncharacterized protein DUF1588/uncharacterized protein DUF1587/uncharacterized protein DUF1585/uncharacterized protein DUF1595/cytochrome c
MLAHTLFTAIAVVLDSCAFGAASGDPSDLELGHRFADTVHPFLENYCFSCHGKEKQKGKLDLSAYSTVEAVAGDLRRWETVRKKLEAEQMPPKDADEHPTKELRRAVLDWIGALRRQEARRNAGDPGPVLARRLSNAEYDNTIRDLTGVDLRPTREFPVDPANEAGFDNSGESLAMSATLLKKYLEAARQVAEHVVLKPNGFAFAPHPVVTDTDRDKYCVKRIVDFYERQPTDHATYFLTAWRFKHRAALGRPEATLAEFAARDGVSPKYLELIWSTLEGAKEETGPIAWLQEIWRELPAPRGPEEGAVAARRGCERMRDLVLNIRPVLAPEFQNLASPGIARGSQAFVLWMDRQHAANRRHCSTGRLRIEAEPHGAGAPDFSTGGTLVLPHDESSRRSLEESLARFCAVFPDAFYLSERGLVVPDEDSEGRGRLLSAGFHLMIGYFRDDTPLCELVLDEPARRELDTLWDDLRFVTRSPERQYKDYIFFERAEPPRFMQGAQFDFARSEDHDVTSEAKIRKLAEAYLAEARRRGGKGPALEAIEDYFTTISAEIRSVEAKQSTAEASHLESLLEFAERAYRRPMSQAEREDLLGFYRTLRQKDGLSHEEALRDAVASVLVSPQFCYRINFSETAGEATKGSPRTSPLSDYALASRLSYFLWASMPDRSLLDHAAAGDLHRPEVIAAEARRMIKDARIRGLATEFGANWLDFRRFEELNSVDRERFKSFTNDLRQAMFEEPIRFFVDLVGEDRSVLDFLDADHTFVNRVLARHYGIPDQEIRANEWKRIDGASRYGRGGLLPMSVFLTRNAPGLRTSPVKRGYWVVRRLLGEVIPPPPPKVPELPTDEAKMGDLTLRDALARHREDPSCAGCHVRFDSLGLVFEGYGPVGERRVQDLGGRPVDARATFPGGTEGEGLAGLRAYLREHRQREFLDNLCRKLLTYALGRSLLLSDDPLIDEMLAKLAASGYRFGSLVEAIVTSPQFLRKRCPDPSE